MKKKILLFAVSISSLSNPAFPGNSFNSFIDAGDAHTIALQCNGTVKVWGDGSLGQLGNNNSGAGVQSLKPTQVMGIGATGTLTRIIAVSAGSNHCLALRCDGVVLAWGDNGKGQIGNGTNTLRSSPVALILPKAAIAIAAGGNHSMALLSDGTVWNWGDNSNGQLGINVNNPNASSNLPVQVLGVGGVGFLRNVIAIAAGTQHCLALINDSTVRAWGKNNNGELGDGGNSQQNVPKAVASLGGPAKMIAAGGMHSLALLGNGTIQAWGNGSSGQLGNGANTASNNTPVNVLNTGKAVNMSAGADYSMALMNDSSVWTWGNDTQGELGNASSTATNTPAEVHGIGNVGFLKRAIAIAAGLHHSVIMVSDSSGIIRTFGDNTTGDLGINSNSLNNVNSPLPVAGGLSVGFLNASFNLTAPLCFPPGTVNFIYTGSSGPGFTYFWDFGSGAIPAFSNLQNPSGIAYSTPGPKTITLIVSNGCSSCSDSSTQVINIYAGAQAGFTSSAPGCAGQVVNFFNTGSTGPGTTDFWDFGSGANPATSVIENPIGIIFSTPGVKNVTQSVTVTGCGKAATITNTITINPLPIADAGSDTTISANTKVQIGAGPQAGLIYSWFPTTTLSNATLSNPVASPSVTTNYIVTVTDLAGCKNQDTIVVQVNASSIWLPNAFTPNGDGKDDVFFVRGEDLRNFEFVIFNRWGERIFYATDMKTGWNGKRLASDQDEPAGAYVYYVKGTNNKGNPVSTKGLVNLIR